MTKEEAVAKAKELYSEIWDCDINHPKYEDTVEEIVIGVIQLIMQPTSSDCVSRQAVLDLMQLKMSGRELYKAVYELPPVTPAQSWISIELREPTQEEKEEYLTAHGEELCYMVESRMPENGQEVLVSHGNCVTYDIFLEEFWNFENLDIENVEAWMPLPKPYEEKRGNKDGNN